MAILGISFSYVVKVEGWSFISFSSGGRKWIKLFLNNNRELKTKKININILNNLDLKNVDTTRFPMVKLFNFLPDIHSLFETVIVAANDKLVESFLNNKIKFTDIQKKLFKIIKKKEFQKFKSISPKNINDITNLNDYVRLKIDKNNI